MSDGRTTSEEFEQLVRRILATQDDEIDCEQVADLVARYVELEVAGQGAPQVLPQVHQHLVQCNACSEIRDVLYELVALEEAGALPDSEDLLDEIVMWDGPPSDRPARTVVGPTAPSVQGQLEAHRASWRAPKSGRRPDGVGRSLAGDRARGDARWVRWAAVVVVLVVIVLLGLWLLQNGGPLSKLNDSMALAAIVLLRIPQRPTKD